MNAHAAAKPTPPFNPAMLRWARDWAGVSIEEAAHRISVREQQIIDWEGERPSAAPTVRQARLLAGLYRRSFLEFFRPEPPALPEPELIPDFRLFRATDDPSRERELKDVQLWAEVQRTQALDLFVEIGDAPPPVPDALFSPLGSNVEIASRQAREAIKFPVEEQIGRNVEGRRQFPNELRRKIEGAGILTFRRTDIAQFRVRGFCIAVFPLPIIVIGSETPAAQAFTLAHELAHVVIRQSAISGPIPRTGGAVETRKIEEWCNRFASAFLMPEGAVRECMEPGAEPLPEISDADLRRMALHFAVSDHAMLIRLVHLRYVTPDYYWDAKYHEFVQKEMEYKGGGRPTYYGSRYRNRQGDLYTGLVLDAWSAGRITNHNAAEYMGIKNIQHMFDIRDHYEGE